LQESSEHDGERRPAKEDARHQLFRRRDADAPSFGGGFYAIAIEHAGATTLEGVQVARALVAIKLLARDVALFQLLRGSLTVIERD
jgi:hypothetical protein